MATELGKDGTVKFSGTPTDIGEITDFSLTTSAVVTADPSLGDDWATNKVGTKSWSATVNANFDKTDAIQLQLVEGAEGAFEFYPTTELAGGRKRTGSGIISGITVTNGGNDPVVSVSFTVTGNGELTNAAII